MAFNAQAYLAANPDVAAAVARGDLSAEAHYQNFGQYEGRDPGGATSGAQTNYYDSQDWQASQGNDGGWGRSADGAGLNNYFQANPDVAREYEKARLAGSTLSPEDYAIQHYDNYGRFEGRGGVLPTGQTTFERQLGSPGGTFYDVYAGAPTTNDVGVFVNPVRGQYSKNIGQYQQDYGNRYGQVGPWGQFLTYNDARAWADANKGNIDSYMTGYKPAWVDDSKTAWSGSQAGSYDWQKATQPGYRPSASGSLFSGGASGNSGGSSGVASPPASNNNSALVDALRQKPNRYQGLGMGLGTSATLPQAKNVDLTKLGQTKTPSGLFQSV